MLHKYNIHVAAYKVGKDADLPEVLEKEIVSELDPRLGSDLPETSVYRNVGKFFEELITAEKEAAVRAQKEPEKPPSEQSSEEESWYKTDVGLPAGGVGDLKVSVQGGGTVGDGNKKVQDDPDKAQNYPPAFPPQNYPPAMPFVPVIPQTIQQVPRPKEIQPEREASKEAEIPVQPKTADVPKPVAPTFLPIPQPIQVEEAKTQEESPTKHTESSRKSKDMQKQDSVISSEEKEKKKAYGKRRGHKTVIPEDKVNSWITASEPFFKQDISPEPLPEPVMPLLVPKPLITRTLPSSKTETGGTSSDKKKRSKSPEKTDEMEKRHRSSSSRRSKSSTSSRDKEKGSMEKTDKEKHEKPKSTTEESENPQSSQKVAAEKESDKDGSDKPSITQEGLLKTTEGGKLVLPKELEESITEFLQKKFKMNLLEVKSKNEDKEPQKGAENSSKTTVKPKQERDHSSPEVEIIEQEEEKRTIKVTPVVPSPVPSPPPIAQSKSPVRPVAPKRRKEDTEASAMSALHVETTGRRQVLLPRSLREKQKGSDPPPAPPVPPLPTR